MLFPMHSRKGWRPRQNVSIERRLAITGACMVMRLELANDLQGFDESFIIGDFEDTDLCMRLHKRNLACAIDHRVRLYHLERKSQVSSGQRWRNNLTLFNAWIHQKRWGSLIENLLEAGEK
jgi:GT2 family glycosyltransferase